MNRWLVLLLPLLVLVGALSLRASDPLPLQELRNKVFDTYQHIEPREWTPGPVVIVDIDDESLARLGQWPWPRTVLADLVERLAEAEAAAVAFDIVFAEPDRTSPEHLIETWQLAGLTEDILNLGELPDHDALFAEALKRMPSITGFTGAGSRTEVMPPRRFGIAEAGDPALPFLLNHPGAVANLPELDDAATGTGTFSVQPDSDGVIRRVPMFVAMDDQIYPGLATESLRVAQGASTYILRASGASGVWAFGESTGMVDFRVGALTVPTDRSGSLVIHDSGHRPERFVPAWRILDGEADPGVLANRIVLVGTSAAGLKDQRASPLDGAIPGVELHAQAIEQIVAQQFLERPDYADGAEFVFLLALGTLVVGAFQIRRMSAVWTASVTGTAIAGSFALAWYAFSERGELYDPVFPAFAIVAIYVAASLPRYLQTEREKRQIRSAFQQYMAPALVEQLAENPRLLRLGGEMRDLTVLFCDIRGFTTISEQFDAEELTNFINRFLTPMTDVIMETGGTIDKYMGDCIMAFWNAPLDDPEHAANACRAARRMVDTVARLNLELEAEAARSGRRHMPVNVGIGINTGICCVGNMGSDQRFDYSCLGDDVNLASRLEGQCKTYGVDTILGPTTRERADDFATLELDLIQVKGKTEPVRIHTLLGDDSLAASSDFARLQDLHAAMLAAYRSQDWGEAENALTAARSQSKTVGLTLDGVYDMFAERIVELRATPPGPGWNGVHISTEK